MCLWCICKAVGSWIFIRLENQYLQSNHSEFVSVLGIRDTAANNE